MSVLVHCSLGRPDYHGWPDVYGALPTSQSIYNPVGGPGDDLCVPANNPPSMCTPGSLAQILAENTPMRDVLDHPPQQITLPLTIDAADSSYTAIDFVPDSFVRGPVGRGAALASLEGDFGFSASNSSPPFPLSCGKGPTPESACNEIGHEVKVLNFSKQNEPLTLTNQRFAKNKSADQAFVTGEHGWNRPTNLRFGPDGCAWIADYGAVRDFGQSDPATKFITPGEGPLVQIPGTGVIFRICPQ